MTVALISIWSWLATGCATPLLGGCGDYSDRPFYVEFGHVNFKHDKFQPSPGISGVASVTPDRLIIRYVREDGKTVTVSYLIKDQVTSEDYTCPDTGAE